MSKSIPGGYNFRSHVNTGRRSNQAARDALRAIVEEQPGPTRTAVLLTKASLALGDELTAWNEIEHITRQENHHDQPTEDPM